MRSNPLTRLTRVAIAAVAAGCAGLISHPVSNLDTTPTNDLPNPYRSVSPWGHLPADHGKWGAFNGVAIDNDGRSVWVVDRCGAGLFVFPHKIYVDRDSNVWVVDMRAMNAREKLKYPDARPAGHAVVKFDPDGKVLMTIGTPGVAGNPPDALTEPCSIVVAPSGDLCIAEGPSGQQPDAAPDTVARISHFTKDGKFIRSFGRLGSGPAEFKTPHDIAMDAEGRLLVADRGNYRIQILEQDGRFIAEWKQFGRPSGVYLRDELIYVADSESNGVAPNPGWLRGIRVGELKTGKVLYRIPDPVEMKGTSAAEGVAVDAMGNVFGGEVGPRQLSKHFRY